MILGKFEKFRNASFELMLIVVGVLLALAVDAWYGRYQEQAEVRQYLQQMLVDLEETERLMRQVDEQNNQSSRAAAFLLNEFKQQESAEREVLEALSVLTIINNPVPIVATADALVATGNLGLIRDSQLRAEIAGWLANIDDFWLTPLYDLESRHRVVVRELSESFDFLRKVIEWRQDFDATMGLDTSSDSAFKFDKQAFFGEQGNYTALTELYYLKSVMHNYRQEMREEARQLRLLIELTLEAK